MSIQQDDSIPDVKVFELDDQGAPPAISAAERFAGKRIVLFAVPGAFTRTCSQAHLPSFVENAEAIKAPGIDEIVCQAVNDAMVLTARAREHGATGKISMVSDRLGEFYARHRPRSGSERARSRSAFSTLCHAHRG